ncbi:Calx-beta domain-containing protein [Algoriphagus namhaensis]
MNLLRTVFSLVIFLLGISNSFQAQAQLAPADIVIVGFNSDAVPDELAIVTLAEIPLGQTIYISDVGWTGTAFDTPGGAEGVITWVTTSAVPAGTLIKITISSPAGLPVIGGGLSAFGSVSASGWSLSSSPVASGGDNWFIYQGTTESAVPSVWIFGFANWSTDLAGANQWLSSGTVSSTTSYLPSALTNGVNALALTGSTTPGRHADNLVYTGTPSGSKSSILAALMTLTNWLGDEDTTQDLNPGGSRFGANPAFTVTVPNSAPVATPPTAPVVNEDITVALADDTQIADADGDDQTVTFTVTGGTLALGTSGITFGGSGNGSASFTASGTLAAINSALDAATFTPTPNLFGSNAGSISFSSNDGVADSNTASVTFTIIGVNDDPTFTGLPSDITVQEGVSSNIDLSSATFGDIDSGSGNVTLSFLVSGGTLTATSGGGVTATTSIPGTLSLQGTAAAIESFLNTPSSIQYTNALGSTGDNAATLSISANDNGNTGTGGGTAVSFGSINIDVQQRPNVTSVSVPANGTYRGMQNLDFTVNFSEALIVSTVGGTPTLNLTIGSTSRGALYLSGSGSSALVFRYTIQSGDLDTDGINVISLITNGGTIQNGGGIDANLTLNSVGSTVGVLVDAVVPTGYSVEIDQAPLNPSNVASASFRFAGAEIGTTYNYQFTSSNGGTPVSGSGIITSASDQISGINLSGLNDGTITLSVTLTDPAGNVGAAVTDSKIKDTTPPVPDLASLPTITAQCVVLTLTPPTATDNLGGTVTVTSNVTAPITTQGTTVVTWTYDDGNGNTSNQNQSIIIDDTTPPTPSVVSLPTVSAQCEVTSLTPPTATDNCGGTISITNNATLPITAQGTTVVTWAYNDGNGNITFQNQNVVIDDITPPTPDASSLPQITAQCEVTSLTPPTATDNCGGTVTVTSNATLPIQSNTVITWSYNDGNGNIAFQNQSVVINDNIDPIPDASSLPDIVAQCAVTSLTAPTATDNCGGLVTVTNNVTLPITAQGTTVITWTFDDGKGNTSTQNQNVVIDDTTPPTPDVANLPDVRAQCQVSSLTPPSATDNCGGSVTVTNNATLPITTQGTTVVTWTYDDGNGNTSTQNQNIVIDDTTPPTPSVIPLPDVISSSAVTSLTPPTATDNCGGSVTVSNNATLPITSAGATVVTWSYDDGNGNVTFQNQNVIINANSLSISDVAQIEGNSGTTVFSFQVSLFSPAPAGGATVDFATVDGTASAGSDYLANNGTLSFAVGESSKTIDITVNSDEIVEADEVFTIVLTNPTGTGIVLGDASATGTITNDDAAAVTIADVAVNEDTGMATLSAMLDNGVQGGFEVDISTSDGTATTIDLDYTSLNASTIRFLGNPGEIQTIQISLGVDSKVEADETILVAMNNLSGTSLPVYITDGATVTILNDDQTLVTIADQSGQEDNGAITLTLTLGNAVQGGFSVDVSSSDGSATVSDGDYVSVNQTISFTGNAGEMRMLTLLPTADSKIEQDETVSISMSNLIATVLSGAIDITDGATVTILNDDQAGLTIQTTAQAAEDATNGVFTVTTSSQFDTNLSVTFETSGSATEGVDYANLGTSFIFPANTNSVTITVPVISDNLDEQDEEVTITLTGTDDSNITVGSPNVATLSIVDNDESPIIPTGQVFTISEDLTNTAGVGLVIATDTDAGTSFQSWTIVSGNEDGVFALDSNTGQLTIADNTNLDRETTAQYTLSLTVSDGTNASVIGTVTVNVLDVNDVSPVISPNQVFAVKAGDPNGTSLGSVAATDGDVTTTTFQNWTIISGNDSNDGDADAPFSIDTNTGEITINDTDDINTANLDFTLLITVSDGVNGSASETIQIIGSQTVLNITANVGQSKVFNTADPVLTFTATGFEAGDDVSILTGALNRVSGENVGTYPIGIGTLDAGNKYAINFNSAVFEIIPAPITGITLADGSFVFDGTAKSLAIAGTLPAGTSVAYSNNSRTNVGTQEVTATITGSNFTTLVLTGDLTITPAPVSGITFADGSFVFDGTAKSLAIAGTLPAGTSVAYSNNSRTNVGTQEVTATITGSNFTTLVLTADLTITPAPVSGITFADGSFVFDGTAKSLAIAGTLPAGTSVAYSNNSRTNVGTQKVTATITGSNFTTLVLTADLTITPAPVSGITLADGNFVFDGTAKSLVIAGTLPAGTSVAYSNNSRTNVGTQEVTATITGSNFTPLVLTADLTITPAPVSGITLADGSFVFDGTAKSLVIAGTLPAGTSVAYSNNSRTNVGTQEVTATITGSNFTTLVLTADLTITPAPVSGITLADGSFVFDGTAKSLVIAGTLPAGTSVAYSNNSRTNVGTQEVTATITGSNFTTLVLTADLTITPATLTIIADTGQFKRFGQPDPILTFNAIGFVANDDEAVLTGALSRAEGEEVGTYPILVGSLAAGANYVVNFTGAEFRILPNDTDGDGVPDDVEETQNTDPGDPEDFQDIDEDGVPDFVEEQESTNPMDQEDYLDSDGDLVPDYVEQREGTDPDDDQNFKDSDLNGVPDYVQDRSIVEFVAQSLVVGWGTPADAINLPDQVVAITGLGEFVNLSVTWDLTGYNPIIPLTYNFTGEVILIDGINNALGQKPILSITVEPKPAPLDVSLSASSFVAIPDVFFQEIGFFTVVDPSDDEHEIVLITGVSDNQYFEVLDGILFWSSADQVAGRIDFTIRIRVTDRAGNVLEKSFAIQRLRTPLDQLEIPNTFTPNNDGVNDTWGAPVLRYYTDVKISVFDTGNNRLFYTENPDTRWDGTFKDKEQPAGAYLYVIEVGETGEVRRGMLNLIKQ